MERRGRGRVIVVTEWEGERKGENKLVLVRQMSVCNETVSLVKSFSVRRASMHGDVLPMVWSFSW